MFRIVPSLHYSMLAAATAIGALGACDNGPAQASNPLLGTWQLAPGASCMIDRMILTPESVTNRSSAESYYAGQESTVPVTYRMDGADRVVVTTRDQATSEAYLLNGPNQLRFGTIPSCVFDRAG